MVLLTLIVFLDGNTSSNPSVTQQITPSMEVCRAAERIARDELAYFNEKHWFRIPAEIQATCKPL